MLIYKLTSSKTDQVYVGKTKQTMKGRFYEHCRDYKYWLDGLDEFRSANFLLEYEDVKMELIEETNNLLREIYWIRKLNSVNFQHNGNDYFISKVHRTDYRLGFIYRFQIRKGTGKNKIALVNKVSTNLEYLRKFRDDWINDNPQLFID